jgi:hypothetical protein
LSGLAGHQRHHHAARAEHDDQVQHRGQPREPPRPRRRRRIAAKERGRHGELRPGDDEPGHAEQPEPVDEQADQRPEETGHEGDAEELRARRRHAHDLRRARANLHLAVGRLLAHPVAVARRHLATLEGDPVFTRPPFEDGVTAQHRQHDRQADREEAGHGRSRPFLLLER